VGIPLDLFSPMLKKHRPVDMEPISVSVYMDIGHLIEFLTCLGEGKWSDVSKAIHDCHAAVHAKGALRIATDVRIGTRIDKSVAPEGGNEHKVRRVEEILAKDAGSASG
jgi:uncharacterized protein YqgV (UPF0045/DUF77 family)